MDIIDEEGGVVASVGNVVADNNLFVADKVVYAEGAQIEIYDIVGREVATGINLVDLSVFDETIVIVKTIYDNDIQFVTKVVVR